MPVGQIFVSYARVDRAVVERIHSALVGKRDIWVDWSDIPPAARFMDEIRSAIEASDAFVFVLSPDSLASTYCGLELAHAEACQKRLVPLVYREVEAAGVPESLRERNWIFARDGDDFASSLDQLEDAVDTDLAWVHEHTRLLRRASHWQDHDRDESLLLRAADLEAAERWLAAGATDKEPRPSALHGEYLRESQKAQQREHRRLKRLYEDAVARKLAAQAQVMIDRQPRLLERSVLLAAEALDRVPGFDADQVVREGLAMLAERRMRIQVGEPIRHVRFSSDGRWLATTDDGGHVRVWDAANGEPILAHRTEGARAIDLAFHPAEPVLAVAWWGGGLELWDPREPEPLMSLEIDRLRALAFAPDGGRLAIGGESGVAAIWHLDRGDVRELSVGAPIWSLAFSPDGRYLATGSADRVARCFAIVDGQVTAAIHHDAGPAVQRLQAGSTDAGIAALAFDLRRDRAASAGHDGTARVWRPESGEEIAVLSHRREVTAVAFVPATDLLATASMDGTACVWDLGSGGLRHRFVHRGIVTGLAVHPDGSQLLTASGDGAARLWDLAEGRELARATHDDFVDDVAFAPDGSWAAAGSWDGGAQVFRPPRPLEIGRIDFPAWIGSLELSPDGRWLACDGQTPRLSVYALGAELKPVTEIEHDDLIGPVRFSLDGERLVTADWRGVVRLLASATGRELQRLELGGRVWSLDADDALARIVVAVQGEPFATVWLPGKDRVPIQLEHDEQVRCVAITRDGTHVATGSDDHTSALWRADDGERIARHQHGGDLRGITFSPGGDTFATACDDHVAIIFEVAGANIAHRLTHPGPVEQIVFCPRGRLIATRMSGVEGDRPAVATVWRSSDGGELVRLHHLDTIHHLVFSADGCRIATASQDRTARLWSLPDGDELVRIDHGDIVLRAALSADGRLLATGAYGASVRVALVDPGELAAEARRRVGRELTSAERSEHRL